MARVGFGDTDAEVVVSSRGGRRVVLRAGGAREAAGSVQLQYQEFRWFLRVVETNLEASDERELKRTRTCHVALENTLDRPNRTGKETEKRVKNETQIDTDRRPSGVRRCARAAARRRPSRPTRPVALSRT